MLQPFDMFRRLIFLSVPLALALVETGCGSFVARRIAQAPNSYPTWFAPHARANRARKKIFWAFSPPHQLQVDSPPARLRYRIVEPADYHFQVLASNWTARGHQETRFTFHYNAPGL